MKSKSYLLSFKGIDIHGVNTTGDTAMHLALYGEKWNVAKKILKEFPNYDVNVTNSCGHLPFYLAVKFKCKRVLLKTILDRTNPENLKKPIEPYGEEPALHVAIKDKSTTIVVELLKHKDVDVNLKDVNNYTALHFATLWEDMPIDLFRKILEKTTDVNTQDDEGDTALHLAIYKHSKTAVKELLKRGDVKVTLKNKDNYTAFDLCHTKWKDIPSNLFRIISDKKSSA